MRTRLETCKTFTMVGVKYAIYPIERCLMSKGAAFQCAKCGKPKCSKFQGSVNQYGMFTEVLLEFWHCAKCGHDFGTRQVIPMGVSDVN